MVVMLLTKQIAELFLIMFFGFVLVKSKLLKAEDSKVLSSIALYLIIPCVIINAFQITYTDDIRDGLVLAFAAALVIHVLLIGGTWVLGKIFHLNGVEKASVIYSNAGNLIFPIVTAVLGEEWVVYASGYIVVQLIFIWSHGKMVICEEKKTDIRKILLNINMIAVFLGMALFAFQLKLPAVAAETIGTMGLMIGPVCMLVAGMLIAGMDIKKVFSFKRIYLVTFLRMLFFPLIVLALFQFSGIAAWAANGDTILLISLLASIAPTAATVTQMAQMYGRDAEYASAIYFITTILCIVTMPVIVGIYQYY